MTSCAEKPDATSVGRSSLSTVLVTGARGFIGRHLVNALLAKGISVIAVDISAVRSVPDGRCTEVVADIRNREFMDGLFLANRFDCVFDLASYTEVGLPLAAYRRNVEQTEAMVGYCNKHAVGKYIFYSTQFVFRRPDKPPQSEVDFAPTEYYGQSKIVSEEYIRSNLPPSTWLILRPTYIWGPGLARFRDGLLYRLAKKQLLISNDRSVKRYYGYVETVAEQTISFAKMDFPNLSRKVYYISDDAISLAAFCYHLVDALHVGGSYAAPTILIRGLGAVGSFMRTLGLPSPIDSMQARELTTNFPVPIGPTLSLTGKTTDYSYAAQRTVKWAMDDPDFRRAVR